MRSRLKLRGALVLVMAVSFLMLVSCGSGDDGSRQARGNDAQPEDLWDRSFTSTAVTEEGEPRPLVGDTRVEVTFEQRDDGGVVRYHAGCNTLGAPVEITPDRLLLGEIVGTDMGCRDELHEQDGWLADFFRSDPRWRLSGDRLQLTTDAIAVDLGASGGSPQ